MKKGDRVVMNGKYYVHENNRNKVFTVMTQPAYVCGTLSVWLEGYSGCYAVDGLTEIKEWMRIKSGTPQKTDFTIVQRPVRIELDCPDCEARIEIDWRKLDVPDFWGDDWGEIECPYCEQIIALGDYDLD